MVEKFDLGIIGGGPAGYTAALHAKNSGLSVVLFEKDKVGGVCLNRGCIPTKTILHSAELYEELKCAEELGIHIENLSVEFSQVVKRKDTVVEKLRKGLELSLKNSGVMVVNTEASPVSEHQIKADNKIYECHKILMATGSKPRELENLKFDHKFILNSDDILDLTELPENILIVGSGAIGTEWARIFSAFGVSVTVVEAAEHLLPLADVEISKRLERIFKTKKIKFYTSTTVEKIDGQNIQLSNGELITPEKVLVAAGRDINSKEQIHGITYIGDACGEIQLAHFAIKQAIAEVQGIKFEKTLVPSVVYGCPEIAWIGKREQDLEKDSYEKAIMLISALGKSHCDNCSEGIIKILIQNDQIIGAHIISKEASSLIQQILIAMQNNISIEKLKEICYAHPTYSEGIFECLFKF